MGKVDIKRSLQVETNVETAWKIVGPNFLKIGEWGPGINKSWLNETAEAKFSDAPAGGRYCDVQGFGKMDERIVHYDNANHEISWSAQGEKLPSFVKGLNNQLKVEMIDDNTCQISTNISADLTGVRGFFLGGPIKKNFSKLLDVFVRDWKLYAETGEISDSKKRAIEKFAKKN